MVTVKVTRAMNSAKKRQADVEFAEFHPEHHTLPEEGQQHGRCFLCIHCPQGENIWFFDDGMSVQGKYITFTDIHRYYPITKEWQKYDLATWGTIKKQYHDRIILELHDGQEIILTHLGEAYYPLERFFMWLTTIWRES